MFPFRYNNGVRIFQSPGYVVIYLEMLGNRVIPIATRRTRSTGPKPVEAWMGNSVGHWEGNTLVVETTNIKSATASRATSTPAPRARSTWRARTCRRSTPSRRARRPTRSSGSR
jgi:hypothetical protein